jgi:hypothetical protein
MTEQPLNPEAVLDAELRLPQYATMSDQAAADAIMAKTIAVRVEVESGVLMDAAMALGVWERLEAAAPPQSTDPPARYARTMMTRLKETRPVNLDHPSVIALVANCVQFGLMTQSEATTLNALGDAIVRWVDANGIGEVGVGAVINSRRRIAGA